MVDLAEPITAPDTATRATRIAYLDSLRGLAALSVAGFFHYQHFSAMAQPGAPAPDQAPLYGFLPVRLEYHYGAFAVDFFFILSGIVFSHVYARDIAAGHTRLGKFWGLRLARLYPIYLASLLAVAVLAWLFHAWTGRFPIYRKNGGTDFVLSLFFLDGGMLDRGLTFNGPAWSLSVEILLYALFFLVARWRADRTAAFLMLLTGIAILMSPVGSPVLFNTPVARGLIGFALGMIVYHHMMKGDRPMLTLLSLAALATLLLGIMALADLPKLNYAVVSAGLALGLAVLTRWRLPQRLLEIKPLTMLGDASLTIYLIHVPIQIVLLLGAAWLGRALPYSSLLFWIFYFALVLAVALPVHHWYERPMRRLLRHRLS